MSDAITNLLIQIKADATSALQAFKNVVTGTTQVQQSAAAAAPAITQVTAAVAQAGQAAHTAGGHIAGLTYYFRSFFDSIRFAMLGNPMAAFYMVDEGIRALVASGMGLMPIAGIIGAIGVAVGASFAWWELFGDHMDRDAKKAEELAKSLDKIPDAVKRAYQAQALGAITDEERKKYEAALAGTQQLYVYRNDPKSLDLRPAPPGSMAATWNQSPTGQFNPFARAAGLAGSPLGPVDNQGPPLVPASAQQVLDYVNQQIDKKMAENEKTVRKNEVSQTDAEQQKKMDKPAVDLAKQQAEILDRMRRARTEELKQISEAAAKQAAADKEHDTELSKQAEMNAEIARARIEAQISDIDKSKLLTSADKLALMIPLEQQLLAMDQARTVVLEKIINDSKSSFEARLDAQKQLNDLTKDQQELVDKIFQQQNAGNVNYQWTAMFASQMDQWTGWAQEGADHFSKAWDGATNSVSAGLTHLFEYGAQRGQWFRTIWNGVIGSMISSTTSMVVDWVSKHIVMQGVSMAFHAVENSLTAQSVATHAAGETAKTGVTTANSAIRQGVYLAETVFHGVMVALRLAAHVAGEVAATAVTVAQALARAIAHAISAAIGAMESEAAVPYVGPILGIAAAAAIMAAAYGMMGGFAAGGYTGDGHPSQVAGVVHAGEYVIPANRVQGSMGLLQAIHSGSLADSVAPGVASAPMPSGQGGQGGQNGQMQHNTHIAIYHNKAAMRQDLEQSDAHEKWVADISARTASKMKS